MSIHNGFVALSRIALSLRYLLGSSLSIVAIMLCLAVAARADCPSEVVFPGSLAVTPVDLDNQSVLDMKRQERFQTTQEFSEQCNLVFNDSCDRTDVGQAFQHRLFAYLASTDTAKQQQAIDFLKNLKRSDFGAMGTTAPLGDFCENTIEDVVGFLPYLATDLGRHGEGDVAMIGLVTALYKYPLPPDVTSHVLSLIDETPTIGSVETVSFGLSTGGILSICGLVCEPVCSTGNVVGCTACVASCGVALDGESIKSPETENHLNNIYVAQYLANQKRFELTGNPKYDNARNGYRTKMIARMRDFIRNDFIEYNAHPYQTYTMFALLSLASYATDSVVKEAAQSALDYVSAKVAVSSNDLIRSTPFRRRNESNHICDDLFTGCGDPQMQFYLMLTGLTDTFGPSSPGGFAEGFGWVAATDYELPPLILDLFVDRSHRKFSQFFHYGRVLQFDGFTDSNDELYYGSPSFLLSAGGHAAHYAYTADVPSPIDLITGEHPGSDVDIGGTVPTTLMPTGDPARSHDRGQMISFYEQGGENMCVAPNFACGLTPHVPDSYPGRVSTTDIADAGLDPQHWTVFDRSGSAGTYGYYVAVYRQDDFGFLEVYDTFGTPELGDVKMFMQKVHENNLGTTYSRSSVNTYKTADGTVLQFTVDAKIVSINGVPPIRDRTNGDVINNDGQGMVTITNPGLPGQQLVLDATIPPDHPTISVPGPIHLPNTCLGTTSYATLNVCNVNSASDDLLIYNIAPNNAQIAVVEPTSGYPTAVSHDFCYPFQVQYTPTVWSSLTSNLAISNSDPNQEYLKVEIDGSAIPPRVSVSGAGNFGNICVDSKAQQTITVGNTGSCSLTVTSIKIVDASGGDCPDFTIRNNPFPNSLGPNASLPATIEFTPTSGGSKTCSLVVASNDPETPELTIPLTATTPGGRLDVAAVGNYPATVIQSVGDCSSSNPLPVSNSGLCPVTIKSVEIAGANGPNYELSGLPSLTTPLQPGHVLGEGNLNVTFSPTQVPLSRGVSDSVIVSYEDDPITHHLTSTTQPLCGEDVTRGMRVLVINGKTGVPLPSVDKIQISRIGGNRKGISVDSAVNVPLQPAVNQNPPCASFKYHREWGGASNPVQLTTGDYQITINAKNPSNGKKTSKTISLTLGTCSFNQNIVVPF